MTQEVFKQGHYSFLNIYEATENKTKQKKGKPLYSSFPLTMEESPEIQPNTLYFFHPRQGVEWC